MNKKLVALAVAGAFATPLAAQAQTANVTLYGRMNLDLEFVRGTRPDGNNSTIHRVSSNSSRLGVRGEEDLGRGLKAIFQIESSVSGDAGGGTLAGRDSFVGLTGNFGTFRMGNMLMPHDDVHAFWGSVPTYLTSVLATSALWGNGSFGGTPNVGCFDCRIPNSIRYDAPRFGGATISGQYATREDAAKGNIIGLGGTWRGGPVGVAAGYERHDDLRTADSRDQAFSIAGNFAFGPATIGATYQRMDWDGSGVDLKRDLWGLSATAKFGAGTLYGAFVQARDVKGSGALPTSNANATRITNGNNTGARQFVVSYTHDLSKRTAVYAGYTRISNESAANYSFNINSYPVRAGGDPSALVLGMIHLF